MEILYLLIPLSVVLAFLIGAAFWWSVSNDQFDDLEGPAVEDAAEYVGCGTQNVRRLPLATCSCVEVHDVIGCDCWPGANEAVVYAPPSPPRAEDHFVYVS